MTELLKIKSKAQTLEGIKKALEKDTDLLCDMTEEEKANYIIGAMKDGSIEADGKNIVIYIL